jgi:hypothetical protein
MNEHLTDEDLVLHHYGEANFAAHLAECGGCRARRAALGRTLDLAGVQGVPDSGAEYGRAVWRSIAPKLAPRRGSGAAWWVWSGAAAAVVAVAFLAGRWTAPAPLATAISVDARQRVFEAALADHLDRAQVMLTQLANDPAGAPEETLGDIVAASRLYRQVANRLNQPGLALLLEDVERVFVEAAHLEPGARRLLQRRLRANDLPFQVMAVKTRLQQKLPGGIY